MPEMGQQPGVVEATVPLTSEQAEHLRRLTSPNSADPELIAGPDWAVMIGLEAGEAFWESLHGAGLASLPFGDSSAPLSARGRDGLRHTTVRLTGEGLQVSR